MPVDAALAASVVLLRETEAGLETYLLHRHARMGFAASMVVFPGGGLDPADRARTSTRCGAARYGRPRRRPASAGARRASALGALGHPELEPRRYDTFFYVAELPGQQADDRSGETDRAEGRRRPQRSPTSRPAGSG